jgi:hypothetical protein
MLKNENMFIDNVFNVMIVLANTSHMVPRMAIYEFLPIALEQAVGYVFEQTKNLTPLRI